MPREPMPGGQRDYDAASTVPVAVYLEERLTRVFQDELRQTRHDLRADITVLGLEVAKNAAQSTKEHAEVTSRVLEVDRKVDGLMPLKEKVEKIEVGERDDEVERRVKSRQRRWAAKVIGGTLTFAAAVAVPVVAVIHP